jgi:hypothetical protein
VIDFGFRMNIPDRAPARGPVSQKKRKNPDKTARRGIGASLRRKRIDTGEAASSGGADAGNPLVRASPDPDPRWSRPTEEPLIPP